MHCFIFNLQIHINGDAVNKQMFMKYKRGISNSNKNEKNLDRTTAISSTTDKDGKVGRHTSTLLMTQDMVNKQEICQAPPNVTTALLADCEEDSEHEMIALQETENPNESFSKINDSIVLINHNQNNVMDGEGCEMGRNGNDLQDEIDNVVMSGK